MGDVEYTDEFEMWWESLSPEAQEALAHDVEVLAAVGPGLGRPIVDSIKGSRYSNMKELRTSHAVHHSAHSSHSTPAGAPSCSSGATSRETHASTNAWCPKRTTCTTNTSDNSAGKD